MTVQIPDDIREQLKAEAHNLVKDAFTHQSDEKKMAELEKHLTAANEKLSEASSRIDELTDVLTSKDEEIASTAEELKALKDAHSAELAEKTKELSDKLAALEAQVADANARTDAVVEERDSLKASLESIEKDRRAEKRVAELSEAKVAFTDEAAKAQYTKVREMGDEDFASYKTELVQVRNLATAGSSTETPAGEEEAGSEEAGSEEEIPSPRTDGPTGAAPQVELSSARQKNADNLGKLMAEYARATDRMKSASKDS